MNLKSDVRDNLKTVIKDKGYIQAHIAQRANITEAALSQILNKQRRLEANEMFDICRAIDMTPMEVMEYVPANMEDKEKEVG